MGSLLPYCADLALVGGMVCEFLGMVLGLGFSGATWFLWIGVFLRDGLYLGRRSGDFLVDPL